MEILKFKDLFDFQKKSNLKASDIDEKGKFPFFTSSSIVTKKTNNPIYNDISLVIGNGGSANVHYVEMPFSATSHCYVAVAKNEAINTKYVYYFLSSNLHIVERGFKGAGLKNISSKYIEEIEIPVPSIEIQNKILAIIDKARSILDKRIQSITKYEELLRATFWEMFSQYQGSNIIMLSDISDISSGLTKGKKYDNKITHYVPYMRVANVQDGYLDLNEIKEIEATEEEIKRYELEKDDLLLTEGGDHDKLGRGTLWKNQIKNCIYQNHIFRVRVKDKEIINPTFLSFQTSSLYGKNYFLQAAKQTSGIASINSTQLKAFPVYVPPISLQNRFEEIVLKIESIKTKLKESEHFSKMLFESISQLAFNGKIKFNTAVDLEILLENDYKFFKEKSSKNSKQLLLDRMNKDEENSNKFSDDKIYEKAKDFIFKMLQEDLINQVYDKKSKSVKLTIQ